MSDKESDSLALPWIKFSLFPRDEEYSDCHGCQPLLSFLPDYWLVWPWDNRQHM